MIWSSVIDSAKRVFKRCPTKSPPKYILYVPGALPMNPISPMEGRPQELGQPVMRMEISRSLMPKRCVTTWSFSTRVGKYLSASANAKGHVGNATQATMFLCKPPAEDKSYGTLSKSSNCCTTAFFDSGISEIRSPWLQVMRKQPTPFSSLEISAKQTRLLFLTRPIGTRTPQCHKPSSVFTHPKQSPRYSNLYGLAFSSFLPKRSSTASRKKSTP